MTHPLQIAEQKARQEAHNCPVYAPGKDEPDGLYKATVSGQRSAACSARWMEARQALKDAGLDPLP